jgi:hypothetical protein
MPSKESEKEKLLPKFRRLVTVYLGSVSSFTILFDYRPFQKHTIFPFRVDYSLFLRHWDKSFMVSIGIVYCFIR